MDSKTGGLSNNLQTQRNRTLSVPVRNFSTRLLLGLSKMSIFKKAHMSPADIVKSLKSVLHVLFEQQTSGRKMDKVTTTFWLSKT
ncbi:unnamed protein product [Clavelina lepadiformis]|uniref:Uncharacterized protein n=1 Tax=Clavelina lepadiformis TaxID=159417 RepID=A0ABP0GEI9_CLALP